MWVDIKTYSKTSRKYNRPRSGDVPFSWENWEVKKDKDEFGECKKRPERTVRSTPYSVLYTYNTQIQIQSKFHGFGRSVTGPHSFSVPSITRQANRVPSG